MIIFIFKAMTSNLAPNISSITDQAFTTTSTTTACQFDFHFIIK